MYALDHPLNPYESYANLQAPDQQRTNVLLEAGKLRAQEHFAFHSRCGQQSWPEFTDERHGSAGAAKRMLQHRLRDRNE